MIRGYMSREYLRSNPGTSGRKRVELPERGSPPSSKSKDPATNYSQGFIMLTRLFFAGTFLLAAVEALPADEPAPKTATDAATEKVFG